MIFIVAQSMSHDMTITNQNETTTTAKFGLMIASR